MNRYYIEDDAGDAARLFAGLQNTARAGRTRMAQLLLSTGLYAGQEGVMELLSRRDDYTLGELAHALGVKPPTVTRTITRLQEQGFVERYASDNDGRQIHVRLTDDGRALLLRMNAAMAGAEEHAFGTLKKKERKQLAKILEKIDAALAADAPPPGRKKSGGAGKKRKKSRKNGKP
ncbi:MarR family winged helix-turn-helix transcriptional regulator [Oricola cellulosilytica]|uniref:MarR family transcriptional regulator n=1 Tax=Oricola cellulosilytica TaxID=1429082 RepID=A0A4R0P3B8_9HYPH|nr:MarR family transcriptional regulator [Oricola cellulosilytica]TCD11352.1 MarR family transcriptional regulator [Oricola cellulosilytica]